MNEVIQQLDFHFWICSQVGVPRASPVVTLGKGCPGTPPPGGEVSRLLGPNTAHLASAFAYVSDAKAQP